MKIDMSGGLPGGELKRWLTASGLRLKVRYTGDAWHAVLTHKVTRAEVSALGTTVEQAIRRAITLWERFGGGSYVGGKRKAPAKRKRAGTRRPSKPLSQLAAQVAKLLK